MNTSLGSAVSAPSSLGSAVSACLQLVSSISLVLCSALEITSKTIGAFGVATASWFDSKSLLVDYVVRHLALLRHHIADIRRHTGEYLTTSLRQQLATCDALLAQAVTSSPRFANNFTRAVQEIRTDIQALR